MIFSSAPAEDARFASIDARDFLDAYAPRLSARQRRVIDSLRAGLTPEQIAAAEQLTTSAVRKRIDGAIERMRKLVTVGEGGR